MENLLSAEEMEAVINGDHGNVFAVLGIHRDKGSKNVFIRAFRPHAQTIEVVGRDGVSRGEMTRLDERGFFQINLGTVDNFSYQFTQLCFCGHSHVPVAFSKRPIALRVSRTIEEIPEWSSEGDTDFTVADAIPVDIEQGVKYLMNVGSIGQPRNHDPRASFCIYDTVKKQVVRYRIPYDIALTQQKIRAANLPERLAARLARGV